MSGAPAEPRGSKWETLAGEVFRAEIPSHFGRPGRTAQNGAAIESAAENRASSSEHFETPPELSELEVENVGRCGVVLQPGLATSSALVERSELE